MKYRADQIFSAALRIYTAPEQLASIEECVAQAIYLAEVTERKVAAAQSAADKAANQTKENEPDAPIQPS